MAVVINELLCFVYSHFGSVPQDSILAVLNSFFSEDELVKAKNVIYEICEKSCTGVPRNIVRKGENKKKQDATDLMNYVSLMDEGAKDDLPTFVARNLRRIPQIDPGSIDLCFLLETVDDLRRKVESLMDIKKEVASLQTMVSGLKPPAAISSVRAPPLHNRDSGAASFSAPTGMANDVNLRVNVPPAATRREIQPSSSGERSAGDRPSYVSAARKPPVIGSKAGGLSTIKASSRPREFHIHVGNLDLDTEPSMIQAYFKDNNVPIRVLQCEIVRSSRVANPRSLSAHVTIDALDKDKAFVPENWPEGVSIRSWRARTNFRSQGDSNRDNWW
jgi:hypothetical protein